MTTSNIKNNVFIVSHIFTKGAPQELLEYLNKIKYNKIVFVGHHFNYCKNKDSFCEVYGRGKLINRVSINFRGPELFFYIKDLLLSFYFFLRFSKRTEVYIGVNCFNVFPGIIFKKLGLVKKLIFYTIDYNPQRFSSNLLNKIYYLLDNWAYKYADVAWNLNDLVRQERDKLYRFKKHALNVIVPIGVKFDKKNISPVESIDKNKIVYSGGLSQYFGADLIIEAAPLIKKAKPEIKIVFIGRGDIEDKIKKRAGELNVADNVVFAGFKEPFQRDEILKKCAVGLAPYEPNPKSYKQFSDVTKPKDYMVYGLPVIITNFVPIAKEIQKNKAGLIINYKEEELVRAVLNLLDDEKLYLEMRQNAINLVQKWQWDRIFEVALKESKIYGF